ncbi:putative T6SS immunity periplasmic lipoprotein [Serratia nevei]|uniref:putative T6SS immunity periplasmic lipoprotein n=1 Tax=Serratia nevei TaxID=2703794 RepID=UPI003FA7507D
MPHCEREERPDTSVETGTVFREEITLIRCRISPPHQCVPDEGYVFTPGQQYHFSAKLVSQKKQQAGEFPSAREFVAEFALQQAATELRLVSLPPSH